LYEGGRTWDILATLQGARRTAVWTCLEGEDKKAALRAAIKAQAGLGGRDYHALLGALDAGDGRIVHGTDLIEKSILAMLYEIKLENPKKEEFKLAIGPYRETIERLAGAVARARSLDVRIDKTHPNPHDQLVDYVSRISLSRQIMTDDPQFWEWVGGYRGIDRFLGQDEGRRLSKANSFVAMLSVQYKHRERGGDHMKYVDSVCQGIMGICDGAAVKKYAQKIADSYDTTFTEMKLLVILEREFGGIGVEVPIPQRQKNADLGLEHEGDTYYVEVYTSRDFTVVGSRSKFRVRFQDEWDDLFNKRQIQALKEANERTVFVLDVGHEHLDSLETGRRDFREHVCAKMPATSEVVIVRTRKDIEVVSVRGGQIVETTGRGRALRSAIARGWE